MKSHNRDQLILICTLVLWLAIFIGGLSVIIPDWDKLSYNF